MNDQTNAHNPSTADPADGNTITPLPGEPGIPQVTAARSTNWSRKGALGLGMMVLTLVLFAGFAINRYFTSGPATDEDAKLVRDKPSAASAGTRALDMTAPPAPRVPALLPTPEAAEPIGVRSGGTAAPKGLSADDAPVLIVSSRPGGHSGSAGMPNATVPGQASADPDDPVANTSRNLQAYLIKRAPVTVGDVKIGLTEYRFKGDTSRVAFTESTFRLATETNSPSVARSMVDVAEARNWHSLRVSGNEDFKRLVWLEAAARGVKTLGYEPNPADLERLKVERELRQVNRIEPGREANASQGSSPGDKPAGRGSGGRKAVLAAVEAVLVANRVPEKQRMAIMAAATEKLAQRIRDGHTLKVKVYDKNAPSQRPAVVPKQEQQRTRERVAPVR